MLISFTGLKRSGKTTLADYVVKEYGFIKINFKDALVQEIKDNFPKLLHIISSEKHCSPDELFYRKPAIMRALLQEYGTEVRRGDNPEYWTRKWGLLVDKFYESNIVTDDCRFINEAKCVRDNHGIIIRIERDGAMTGNGKDTHQSETEMIKIKPDYIIVNDSTKKNLFNSFNGIYNQINKNL